MTVKKMNKVNKTKYIYIARHILLCNDPSCGRIDEEAVFVSWQSARYFLVAFEEAKPSREDLLLFRNSIVRLPFNTANTFGTRKIWTYSIDGTLIDVVDESKQPSADYLIYTYKGLYSKGDIVHLIPNSSDPHSWFIKPRLGVIWQTPQPFNEWINAGENASEWDAMYTIITIEDNGLLNHRHLPERVIKGISKNIPDEYRFLIEVSECLRGRKTMPENIIEKALSSDLYVKYLSNYYYK